MIAIHHLSPIFVCCQALGGFGICRYALCRECYQSAKGGADGNSATRSGGSRPQRSTTPHSPHLKKHNICYHGVQDLTTMIDAWWCLPTHIGKSIWYDHPHGCFKCGAMFIQCKTIPTDWKFPTWKKMDKHVAGQYRKSKIDKSRNNLGLDEE